MSIRFLAFTTSIYIPHLKSIKHLGKLLYRLNLNVTLWKTNMTIENPMFNREYILDMLVYQRVTLLPIIMEVEI